MSNARYRYASNWHAPTLTALGMIGVFLLGAFCVAAPTGFMSYLLLTTAVVFFFFAGSAAFALAGPDRAYWGGLSFVGLAYLLLALHPWFTNISSNLVTTRLLAVVWTSTDSAQASKERRSGFFDESPILQDQANHAAHFAMSAVNTPMRSTVEAQDLRNIMISGQAAWSMFLALPGGLLCYSIWQRRLRWEGVA